MRKEVCTNTIMMTGSADLLFELAANIQDWPTLLPHYRYVRLEDITDTTKVARMGASRDGFPVTWRCRQELLPDERRILFRHIGGVSRGMEVEWRIEQDGDALRVTIRHELAYPVPVLGPLFARYVVGRLFVHNIAGKTLRCMKQRLETAAQEPAVTRHDRTPAPGA